MFEGLVAWFSGQRFACRAPSLGPPYPAAVPQRVQQPVKPERLFRNTWCCTSRDLGVTSPRKFSCHRGLTLEPGASQVLRGPTPAT